MTQATSTANAPLPGNLNSVSVRLFVDRGPVSGALAAYEVR